MHSAQTGYFPVFGTSGSPFTPLPGKGDSKESQPAKPESSSNVVSSTMEDCDDKSGIKLEAGLGAGQPRSPALTSRLFNWLGEALVKLPVKARIIIRTYSRSTLVCCCCLDS